MGKPKRRTVGLVAVGLVVGLLLISPAGAHFQQNVGHLGKHIWNSIVKPKSDARYVRHFAFFTGPGSRTIAKAGGMTVRARCDINATGTDDVAEFRLLTTTNGNAMDDNNGPEDVPFGTAQSPAILFSETSDDTGNIEVGDGGGLTAVAGNGTVMNMHDYALGVNLPGEAGRCFFTGQVSITKT